MTGVRWAMAVSVRELEIVSYPAPVLRAKAKAVGEITGEVRAVAERMIELMREAEGVGLAAPQVGLSWRMFVCHVPPGEKRSVDDTPATATRTPLVCINPSLHDPTGELETYEEGCLSLPDIRGDVLRPPVITLRATGLDGKAFTMTGAGLLARCWQHEQDHLDGVLIIDKMTQIYRLKNKAAVRALEREAGL